jgi:hypothetical protein
LILDTIYVSAAENETDQTKMQTPAAALLLDLSLYSTVLYTTSLYNPLYYTLLYTLLYTHQNTAPDDP